MFNFEFIVSKETTTRFTLINRNHAHDVFFTVGKHQLMKCFQDRPSFILQFLGVVSVSQNYSVLF
jgi:hypothetical protein